MEKIIKPIRNSGFVFEKEQPQDYILGGSPLKAPPIMFPTGHGWHGETVRAKSEMQFNRHFDTFSCVLFGIAKALVAYAKKAYGVEISVAEMFNAFAAGVVPNRGTSVRNGLESFRTKGWVEDSVYPFTPETTAAEYFKKPPTSIYIKASGKLTKWKVHWELIASSGNVSHDKIKEELKRTPIVASGFAWASYYGEGIYYDYNNPANHLFLIDDWADEKKYDLLAYDSYPQDRKFDLDSEDSEFVKKLARSYRVHSAHRIWLTPANNNLIDKIMDFWRRLKTGKIYWGKSGTNKIQEVTKENAGLVAVTHLMRQPGQNTKNITEEDLKDYEVTEEFFGSNELGVADDLLK